MAYDFPGNDALIQGPPLSLKEFMAYSVKPKLGLSLDADIPNEFTVDGTAMRRYNALTAEIEAVKAWTDAESAQYARQSFDTKHAEWRVRADLRNLRRQRYNDMLQQLHGWEPPEHSWLAAKHRRAIRHLETALAVYCNNVYDPVPTLLDAHSFKQATLRELQNARESHMVIHEHAVYAADQKNHLLREFHRSFPVNEHTNTVT